MKDGYISVIIPIYNAELYLEKCLESVTMQTYTKLQIILIDDGSTDRSSKICDEWLKKDNRIMVNHTKNQGVSSARNTGLSLASGEFISMIDADDILDKNLYMELINSINMNKSDLSVCNFFWYNGKESMKNIIKDVKNKMDKKDFLEAVSRRDGFGGYLWNKLYKKKIIGDLRFQSNVKIMEDLLFNFDLSDKISFASYVDKPLYYYRQWDGSALNRSTLQKDKLLLEGLAQIIAVLDTQNIISSDLYKLRYIFEAKKIITLEVNDKYNEIIYNNYKKYLKLNIFLNTSNTKWKIKVILILLFPTMYCKLRYRRYIKGENLNEEKDFNNYI